MNDEVTAYLASNEAVSGNGPSLSGPALTGQAPVTSSTAESESFESTIHLMTKACGLATKRFETLFQNLPIAAIGFDDSGMIFEANRAVTKSFGLPAHFLIHQTLGRYVTEREFSLIQRMIRGLVRGEKYSHIGWQATLPNGQTRFFYVDIFPLPGADDQFSGAVALFVDATLEHEAGRLIPINAPLEAA